MRSVDDQGEGLLLNSYDRTLVIKQISSEDVADMHNILSEYHQVRSGWLQQITAQLKSVCLSVLCLWDSVSTRWFLLRT